MHFLILICEHCGISLRGQRGDLPATCPKCRERGFWRIALPGEITTYDRIVLKHLGIAVEDPVIAD